MGNNRIRPDARAPDGAQKLPEIWEIGSAAMLRARQAGISSDIWEIGNEAIRRARQEGKPCPDAERERLRGEARTKCTEAERLMDARRYQEAFEMLLAAFETAQDGKALVNVFEWAHMLGLKGELLNHLDRNEEALEFFDVAIQLTADPFVLHSKGKALESLGDWEGAGECFKEANRRAQALRIHTQDACFTAGIASVLYEEAKEAEYEGREKEARRKLEEALSLLKKVEKVEEGHSDYLETLAVVFYRLGRNEEAIAAASELVKYRPDDSGSWVVHANLLHASKRDGEALASAEEALKYAVSEREQGLANAHKAVLLVQLGREGEAGDVLSSFGSITSPIKNLWLMDSWELLAVDEYRKAELLLRHLERLCPDDYEARLCRGAALLALGDAPGGCGLLEKALKASREKGDLKESEKTLWDIAVGLLTRGRADCASQIAEVASGINPRNNSWLVIRANAANAQGKPDEAKMIARQLGLSPDNVRFSVVASDGRGLRITPPPGESPFHVPLPRDDETPPEPRRKEKPLLERLGRQRERLDERLNEVRERLKRLGRENEEVQARAIELVKKIAEKQAELEKAYGIHSKEEAQAALKKAEDDLRRPEAECKEYEKRFGTCNGVVERYKREREIAGETDDNTLVDHIRKTRRSTERVALLEAVEGRRRAGYQLALLRGQREEAEGKLNALKEVAVPYLKLLEEIEKCAAHQESLKREDAELTEEVERLKAAVSSHKASLQQMEENLNETKKSLDERERAVQKKEDELETKEK